MLSLSVAVGESGGDFYNYLLMAKSFLEGGSIFIEKRLPIYALLLIPGHLIGHPLGYARVLGIILALLTLYLFYRLLIDLRLPKAVALTSLILLSWQPTFFLFSLRPLSHTLFNFEVVLCLLLFHKITRGFTSGSKITKSQIWKFVAFGLVLGVTAMTRHEGFLVAGVLMGCLSVLVLGSSLRPRGTSTLATAETLQVTSLPILTAVTLGLVVLPWFISNYQRFGNPFYSQYQTDAGLNVAVTPEKLLRNALQMRDIFLGMWGDLGFVSVREPWLMLTRVESFGEVVTVATILLMLVGLAAFVKRLGWLFLPIILVFITQAGFLSLVQPWPRHSQHLFFFPATLLALGTYQLLSIKLKRLVGLVVLLILLPVFSYLVKGDQTALADYIRGGGKTLPLLQAAKTLNAQYPSGQVLVSKKLEDSEFNDYSLITYYLGGRITTHLTDNPTYILDYSEWGLGIVANEKLVPRFNAMNGSYWARIYQIL